MDVKQRVYNGESISEIGKEYGLDSKGLRNIANGYSWKHILPHLNEELNSRVKTPVSVKDKAVEIKTLMYEGKTNTEICNLLNVRFSVVSSIRTLRRYKNVLSEYNDIISSQSITRKAFSIEEVEYIKKSCVNGVDFKLLSTELNYKNTKGFKTRIRDIAYVNRFKDVLPELNEQLKLNIPTNKKLEDKVEEIKTMMYEGKSDAYIKKITNTSSINVSKIRKLEIFKDILSEYNAQITKNACAPKIMFTEHEIINIKIKCVEKLDYEDLALYLNKEASVGFKARIRDIIFLRRYVDLGSEYNEELRRLYGKRQ